MDILPNPHRGTGLTGLETIPLPEHDAEPALRLLARCPVAAPTPLHGAPDLAQAARVAALWVKDERGRMGLGSFKALGAAHVIARDAEAGRAAGRTYVAASAGNHGLSVAAGAAAFGAKARIYLSDTVPESFAARLRDLGAKVVRAGAIYEDSMAAAAEAAEREGLNLLSDSSWPGYVDVPRVLMEGYLVLIAEAAAQIEMPPTHIFVQAGVGGIAAAVAAHARAVWGAAPCIVVVEPEAAPALTASIAAGAPVVTEGPVSSMGRLDCKEPSLIALRGLARDADWFVTITEAEAAEGTALVAAAGLPSTPSGAAGLAALLLLPDPMREALAVGPASRVLTFLTEAEA
jgi:diaminopropionate ammonia-lyase